MSVSTTSNLAGVRRSLERDGYSFVDGRITGGPATATVREGSLSAVEDPAAIREHLDRISRALADDDPRQAIGSAKELIESTAKLVLRTRGLPVNDRDDFPELVRAAQTALEVHPKQATAGPDRSDAVKRILGGATAAALGVNELRNRGFGTGHGNAARPAGLGPRHAHLAAPGWPDADTRGIELGALGEALEERDAADRAVLHLLRRRAGWDDGTRSG